MTPYSFLLHILLSGNREVSRGVLVAVTVSSAAASQPLAGVNLSILLEKYLRK